MGFWHSVIVKQSDNQITKPDDVKLGYWHTQCCHNDLEQITTQEDLESVRADLMSENPLEKVWRTQRESLLAIREYTFIPDDSEMKAEIDELLDETSAP